MMNISSDVQWDLFTNPAKVTSKQKRVGTWSGVHLHGNLKGKILEKVVFNTRRGVSDRMLLY